MGIVPTNFVVYYESIKRELKIRCIYECRCDERLQTKTKEFTRLAYTTKLRAPYAVGFVQVYLQQNKKRRKPKVKSLLFIMNQ